MSVPSPPAQHERDLIRQQYMREVLSLYLATPGVAGRIRRADRDLARTLFEQNTPLHAVANAFIVAAARRTCHNAYSTPMPPIRSLHYFRSTIREMLERPPGYREIEEFRQTLRQHR